MSRPRIKRRNDMENIKITIYDAELHSGAWDNGDNELDEIGCLTIQNAAAEPENLKKITNGILEMFPHSLVGVKVSYSISNH
jgi:hypothetical protein